MSEQMICANCGKRFEATRSAARYCSPACRQQSYRNRQSTYDASVIGRYRTRQEAVKERLDALLTAYKARSAADIALLSIAAIHLVDAEKARNRTQRVRATNAAMRALREIPRQPEAGSIDEALRGLR